MKNTILNPINFIIALFLVLSSCEKKDDFSEVDSITFNEMNVASIAIKKNKESALYAFTPSNVDYLNLDYKWYVNGELQLNTPSIKSLFQYTFTKNGNFTICFEPSKNESDSGELHRICTELNFENFKNFENNAIANANTVTD